MMRMRNSYIFLPKDAGESITKRQSVAASIRRIFGVPVHEDTNEAPFKMIYTYEIEAGGISHSVVFTVSNVTSYTYLDVELSGKTRGKAVNAMECVHEKLLDSEMEDKYVMISSYDSISEYYCNLAYPKLNRLERNLRKLLLNTYTVNFGAEYYHTTVDSDLQNKIMKVVAAKGSEQKRRIERLKRFFYSMEFSDIQILLFDKRWTKLEEAYRTNFLEKNERLTALSERELREAFEKSSPKSDWERLFADKGIQTNIAELIEQVRVYRNDIAHCKFFYRDKYQSFNNAFRDLNRSIERAIRITEEKDFEKKNSEAIFIAFSKAADAFAETWKSLKESIEKSMRTVIEGVAKVMSEAIDINETGEWVKDINEGLNDMRFPGLLDDSSEEEENE